MNRLALLTLFLYGPAFAATIGSSGWTCADIEPDAVTVTIDAGSDRKLVYYFQQESNSGTVISTWTVGGVAATHFLEYDELTATNDHWHRLYLWNEADIGTMTGTDVSYADDNAQTKRFCYATILDTNQDNIALADSVYVASANTIDVDTVSTAGDYVFVGAIASAAPRDFTDWDTLTEQWDETIGGLITNRGGGSGAGGDSVTTVTGDGTAGEYSAIGVVFPDAGTACPICVIRHLHDMRRRQ
jgi:hypothetical protein